MARFHKMHDHLQQDLQELEMRASGRGVKLGLADKLFWGVGIAGAIAQIIVLIRHFGEGISALWDVLSGFLVMIFNALYHALIAVLFSLRVYIFDGERELAAFGKIWRDVWSEGFFGISFGEYLATTLSGLLRFVLVFWPALIALVLMGVLFLFIGRGSSSADGEENLSHEEMQNRIGQLRAGIEGEKRMADLLKRLPNAYDVFQNLYVTYDGETSETDFVVIGSNGAFVIETKNYSGSVYGNAANERLIHKTKNGEEERFYNPARQVGTHVYRLHRVIGELGCRMYVQGIVAFVGKADVNVQNPTDTPIFSGNGLNDLCTYICRYPAHSAIEPAHQKIIVASLENS